jgi:hypothetical protein
MTDIDLSDLAADRDGSRPAGEPGGRHIVVTSP